MTPSPKVDVQIKNQFAKILATENITVLHKKIHTAAFDVKTRVLYLPMFKDMQGILYDMFVAHEVSHALHTPVNGLSNETFQKIDPDRTRHKNVKSFLNIIEDIRIEKLIKRRYPGIRKVFPIAYQDLINRNFFGTQGKNLDDFLFIDRINLYFKTSGLLNVKFSSDEQVIVSELEKLETWGDTLIWTKKLYEYCQKEIEEKFKVPEEKFEPEPKESKKSKSEEKLKKSKEDSKETEEDFKEESKVPEEKSEPKKSKSKEDSKEESEESNKLEEESKEDSKETEEDFKEESKVPEEKSEPKESNDESKKQKKENKAKPEVQSETQTQFEKNMESLNDDFAKEILYVQIPKTNLKQIIIPFKQSHEIIREFYSLECNNKVRTDSWSSKQSDKSYQDFGIELFSKFKEDNKQAIQFLIQQFEMKKAANQQKRISISKTGKLNTNKLYSYKYSDDIFLSSAAVADAKSHGLMILIDWSGSQKANIQGIVEQLLNILLFARRENIPFEVYTFGHGSVLDFREEREGRAFSNEEGEFHVKDKAFTLNQIFSSKMNKGEFYEACRHIMIMGHSLGKHVDHVPISFRMGMTPLNETIFCLFEITKNFQKSCGVQKVNIVFLTDGEGNSEIQAVKEKMGDSVKLVDIHDPSIQIIIRDSVTKKEYTIDFDNYKKVERSESILGRKRRIRRTFARRYSKSNRGIQTMVIKNTVAMTDLLLQMLKERFDVHVVNFYISGTEKHVIKENLGYATIATEFYQKDNENLVKDILNNKYKIFQKNIGFDELYFILGGNELRTTKDLKFLDKNTSKKKIAEILSDNSKSKVKNRILLMKFIEMIS